MRQSCFVMTMRGVIVKSNYPYAGDHPAEPPSVSDCEFCDGFRFTDKWDAKALDWLPVACEHCTPAEPDPEPEFYPD